MKKEKVVFSHQMGMYIVCDTKEIADGVYDIPDATSIKHIRKGHLHNNTGPAIEFTDGNKYWFLNGSFIAELTNGELTIHSKSKFSKQLKQSIAMEMLKNG